MSPDRTADATAALVSDAARIEDQARTIGADDVADRAAAVGASAARDHAACRDTLAGRRTLTLILAGLAVAVPLALVWVGGHREPTEPSGATEPDRGTMYPQANVRTDYDHDAHEARTHEDPARPDSRRGLDSRRAESRGGGDANQ